MARAAQRGRKRAKPHAQRRRPSGGGGSAGVKALEQTMFFPRLRRQAKWMFVFLALVFGVGFVAFGVGSDLPSGVADVLQSGGSSGQPSLEDAREAAREHPNDAQAQRELATAAETAGETDEAIGALEEYSRLRPRDAETMRELAGLYLTKADRLRDEAQLVQFEAQSTLAEQTFAPPSDSPLGRALGQDAIARAVSEKVNTRFNDIFSRMQSAYGKALSVYRSVESVLPRDPTVQLELAQAAEAAGETATAIAAYEKFLKLAPEDPTAPAIRERIGQLRSPSATAG